MFKDRLKEIRPLVVGTRFLKRSKGYWRDLTLEYSQEKQAACVFEARQKTIQHYLKSHDTCKLQIGTGNNPLSGWLNTDLEPTADEIVYMDATTSYPFPDAVFDVAFSEHMIEHISYRAGLFMLTELFRVLKPGGMVRIATPNIERIIGLYADERTLLQQKYLEWSATHVIGLYVPEQTSMQKWRPEWDLPYEHIRTSFPDAQNDSVCFVVNNFFRSFGHQFLYDVPTMKAAMEWVGFTDVTYCEPGQSKYEDLKGIESHHHHIGNDMNQLETMILEAKKPKTP